jgi:CMP-N,N'-diacetyllegionaminic acid synthase
MSASPKVYAVVPARGGSKGVPKKNIRRLAGYPLIAYSIAAGFMSRLIERVIVSTDSPEIAEVSRKYGAEVPFLRPAELAQDKSRDRDFVLHLLHWLQENEGGGPDYLVHLRPTTPLRDPAIIDDAIGAMMGDPTATSLRSAHEAPETPFKWFTRNDQGYYETFAHADAPAGFANWPRQMLPKVFIPDGYVDVLKTAYVLGAEEIHGDRMVGFITPACSEVDTLEDFAYLEFQVNRTPCRVLDFLRAHYPEDKS